MLELNKLYNMNCMKGMKQFPDKYFELAIVDPPYFSGPEKRGYYGRKISPIGVQRHYNITDNWDIPGEEYFIELARVSKNQIIWGCNYYKYIFSGSGRIVWDKCNGESSFSDVEIAYCSMHDSVRLIRYMWNGMMQGKSISEGWIQQGDKSKNEVRIHPTQKPVKLYKWLLMKYAKPGICSGCNKKVKLYYPETMGMQGHWICPECGMEYPFMFYEIKHDPDYKPDQD